MPDGRPTRASHEASMAAHQGQCGCVSVCVLACVHGCVVVCVCACMSVRVCEMVVRLVPVTRRLWQLTKVSMVVCVCVRACVCVRVCFRL